MTRSILAILIVLTAVFTSSGTAQPLDPVDELKACAKMTARDARNACFDNLSERLLREESADEEPAHEIVAQPAAEVTPAATTGQPSLDGKVAQQKVAQPEATVTPAAISARPTQDDAPMSAVGRDRESNSVYYSGRISSCKKGHYGDWFFIFADGQVWKEVSRRKLDFEECDFDATITRDAFGYKLSIDAQEKPIRIKRQK